jgi:hypothetical protein
MKALATSLMLLMLLTQSAAVHADDCTGLLKILEKKNDKATNTGFFSKLAAAIKKAKSSECGSLATVYAAMFEQARAGGRRLEDDKPFDQTAAKNELDEALQDATVKEGFAKAEQDTSDENTQLFVKAAVLDSAGYYDARELLLQQLKKNLTGASATKG